MIGTKPYVITPDRAITTTTPNSNTPYEGHEEEDEQKLVHIRIILYIPLFNTEGMGEKLDSNPFN